jgi:hypothetical protein
VFKRLSHVLVTERFIQLAVSLLVSSLFTLDYPIQSFQLALFSQICLTIFSVKHALFLYDVIICIIFLWNCLNLFRHIYIFARSPYWLRFVSLSICAYQIIFHWTYFREIGYWIPLWQSVKIKIGLKLDKNFGHFTWRPKYVLLLLET